MCRVGKHLEAVVGLLRACRRVSLEDLVFRPAFLPLERDLFKVETSVPVSLPASLPASLLLDAVHEKVRERGFLKRLLHSALHAEPAGVNRPDDKNNEDEHEKEEEPKQGIVARSRCSTRLATGRGLA